MKFKKLISSVLAVCVAVSAASVSSFSVNGADDASGTCGDGINWSLNASTGVLTVSGNGPMDPEISSWNKWTYSDYADSIKEVVFDEGITAVGKNAFGYYSFSAAKYPNLKKVTFPSTLKEINSLAFSGDTSLEQISDLSQLDGLYIAYGAFSGCTSLTGNIVLPENVTGGYEGFQETAITGVKIPATAFLGSDDRPDSMFDGCTSLESVELEEGLKVIGNFMFRNCTKLESIVIPNSLVEYEYFGYEAFSSCTGLKSITIPENMKKAPGGLFNNCAFESVTIPKGMGAEVWVSTYGGMAANARNSSFASNENLKTVTISDGVTSLGYCIFERDINIEEIYVYSKDLATVEPKSSQYASIDKNANPTYYVYKGSKSEKTLKNAGYLTDENTVYILDTKELENAIAEAEAIDTALYTDESVKALTDALESAKAALDSTSADVVDAATEALKAAINALELKPTTFTVSGTITVSDENADEDIVVTLLTGDVEIGVAETNSMGEYVIEDLKEGSYTLVVAGGNYVQRAYEVTVAGEDVTQDVELNLLGDINGDGKISTADVGMANSHAKGVNLLEGYKFDCADVRIDGTISTADVGMINSHAKGVKSLWD